MDGPVHFGLHAGKTNSTWYAVACAWPHRLRIDGRSQLDENTFSDPEYLQRFQQIERPADGGGGDAAVQCEGGDGFRLQIAREHAEISAAFSWREVITAFIRIVNVHAHDL